MTNNQTTNGTLMELAQTQSALWELIEESGGELTPMIEQWLDEVQRSVAFKVDGYHAFMDALETDATRLKTRASELRDAANRLENLRELMKNRIKVAMGLLETTEIKGQYHRFKLVNGAPSLIVSKTELPSEYLKEIVTIEPDRERIVAALKAGEQITGAALQPTQQLRSYVNTKGRV
jgi:hypothetical protein